MSALVITKARLRVIHFAHNDDLPQSVKTSMPDAATQTLFRQFLNNHLGTGVSEMHAYIKSYKDLEAAGYACVDDKWDVKKYSPDQPRDDRGRFGEGTDTDSQTDPSSMVSMQTRTGVQAVSEVKSAWTLVSQSEKSSLADYKGFSYSSVNKYQVTGKVTNENTKPMTADISAVMKRSSLIAETSVYRGVNGSLAAKLATLEEGATGKIPCFQSTTVSHTMAKEFATGARGEAARQSITASNPTIIKMTLPSGYHALPLAKLAGYADTEKELLVDKGGKFTVVSNSMENGLRYIHLKVSK